MPASDTRDTDYERHTSHLTTQVRQAAAAERLPQLAPLPLCISCERALGVVRPTPLRSAVCGPCWARHGGQAGGAETGPAPVRAVPVRAPHGQKEWLDEVAGDPMVLRRNRPTRERLLTLVRELAYHANWDTLHTWPTWQRLQAATGWARSTMAAWLRELRLRGWLTILEHGSTPRFRPMARADVHGNRAAVYSLAIPLNADTARNTVPSENDEAGDKTWTPTHSFDLSSSCSVGGSSRARNVFHNHRTRQAAEAEYEALRAQALEEEEPIDFTARVPVGRAQMLAAAGQLRREHPILARMSPRAVRAACRPYWHGGWTGADILDALTYRPTSWSALPSPTEYDVIHPDGWVRSRLGAWRGPRGRVLESPSHRRTQHEQVRSTVRARHGHGLARLLPPYSRRMPTARDIRERGRALHQQAQEAFARQRRRERADALAKPRSPEQAASAHHRRAAVDDWRQAEQQRRNTREQVIAHARAAHPQPAIKPEQQHSTEMPPARSSEEAFERARARAATDRRHTKPRPRRRRA